MKNPLVNNPFMACPFKLAFFTLIVRPVVFIVLGVNVFDRNNLPARGPAIIVANHNSHLDTLVLMSLFPLRRLHRIRPVAAADYFLRNPLWAWFARHCIGIIPLDRSGGRGRQDNFRHCHAALDNNDILILFPEGSRGNAEKMSRLRKGIYFLLRERPATVITPVLLQGLGRVLPKGDSLLVPFNCDVVVGEPLDFVDSPEELLARLSRRFQQLSTRCLTGNLSSDL